MSEQLRAARVILRRRAVEHATGKPRSTLYEDIAAGLMVPPVPIGVRAVGWPSDEVEAINAARIAGKSPDEIRELVARLVSRRASFPWHSPTPIPEPQPCAC
jgi:prophage regulatory protein